MNSLDDRCCEFQDTRKKVVTEENKRKHIGNNPEAKEIARYRVDGCLQKDPSSRCDFLLLLTEDRRAVLIELKGSDVNHGFGQLLASCNFLTEKLPGYRFQARLISSKNPSPKLRLSNEKKLRDRLKKLNGDFREEDLRKQSRKLEETL